MLSAIILLLIIMSLLAVLLLNVGGVQNYLARRAGEFISKRMGTTVSIDRLRIRGFNQVAIKGFYVEDLAGDTLIYARDLSVTLNRSTLLSNDILIGDTRLDGGKIYLFQPRAGAINIQKVTDALDDGKKGKSSTRLTIRNIEITNTVFKYQREGEEHKRVDGMNYGNLIFRSLNVGSKKLRIDGKRITMDLHGLSFKDVGGFEISDMSVDKFVIDNGLLDFTDTRIETPESNLIIPRIELKGNNWRSFKDFGKNVNLDVRLERSDVHTKTLGYLIPRQKRPIDLLLSGVELTFGGTVNDFGGRIANLTYGATSFEGTYAVKNIRTIERAQFAVEIERLATDGHDMADVIKELSERQPDSSLIRILHRAGVMNLTGKVEGLLTDFNADVEMSSELGDVALAAAIEHSGGGIRFNGDVKVDRLNVGHIVDQRLLGHVTADGHVMGLIGGRVEPAGGKTGSRSGMAGSAGGKTGGKQSGKGNAPLRGRTGGSLADRKLDLEGNFTIPALEYNGYTYGNVTAEGSYRGNVVSGHINSGDRNLKFDLTGSADLRRDTAARYNLSLDLKRADLRRLNINRRDSISMLSGRFDIDASGNSIDNINGTILVDDLLYVSPADSVRTGKIVFTGRNSADSKYLSLESSFLDADFTSQMSYGPIVDYLGHIIYDYIPALKKGGGAVRHTGSAANVGASASYGTSRVRVNVKQAGNVAAIFLPGFKIAEDSRAELLFDPTTEELSIEAESNFIEYDKFLVTKLDLRGDNYIKSDSLSLVFTTDELMFPGLSLPSSSISAQALGNHARVKARISNDKTKLAFLLDLAADFSRDPQGGLRADVRFQPSHMTAGRRTWDIRSESIVYMAGRLEVKDFRITDSRQGLFAGGVISGSSEDVFSVSLDNITLAPLSGYISEWGYSVDGTASGRVEIRSAASRPLVDGEVMFDNLKVNDISVMPLRFGSQWDFRAKRAALSLTDRTSGREIVRGYYNPTDGSYLGDLEIVGLPLAILDPLLAGAVKTAGGSVDIAAEVKSKRPGNNPVITGNVHLADVETTVEFSKATYRLPQADLRINNNIAALPATAVFDSEGNRAELSAEANLSNFSAISYSANLTPHKIIVLNTSASDSKSFYGKVYASGDVKLKGNKMGVEVYVTAQTGDNSFFFMSPSGKSSVASTDFIVFESKHREIETDKDVVEQKKETFKLSLKGGEKVRTNVKINMAVDVLPNTMVTLVLDREQSNVISARGNASLNMTANPRNNEFSLYGNYEISEGDYTMNMQAVNKKFDIRPGGTIQWTGDPANAILNLSAVYKLRASPAGLLEQGIKSGKSGESGESGESNQSSRVGRVPVECIITITGRLSEPDFAFSINAPTLDAEQQTRLAAALSSKETAQTQFMYLVAFGTFYGGEDVRGEDMGSATASAGIGLLTSKLSDMISSGRTRFTFGYRAPDKYSSSEVDIGFSTDIVSDRVFVEFETNVNTGDNKGAIKSNNNVMNYNVTVTGVLNKSGKLRAKAFTRAIDRFDNRGLQETGVGVYYREDFDKIADIWRNARERRARRRQKGR